MAPITATQNRFLSPSYSRPKMAVREWSGLRDRLRAQVAITRWRLDRSLPGHLKRAIDLITATLLLALALPLFGLVALLIKLTDGGPVLYWQERVGKWGRRFPMPKFRTMVVNADHLRQDLLAHSDHDDEVRFKMKRDPRITWIGRILRRLSIDESPQLWNVLRGDMSLVGPRPPIPEEVTLYTLHDRLRLDVTPGLTCIWQVSGRADIPFPRQVEMDVEYVRRHDVRLDLQLLLQTVPAVLGGRGAY